VFSPAHLWSEEDLTISSPTTDPALCVLVPLSTDPARTIDTLAQQRGQDRVQFIVDFLQEQLSGSPRSFKKRRAPIAADFRGSGMIEQDLDALVEQERQAMWDEKHS
jgi:hypothetical protein